MTLTELRYVVALAQEKHFGKAAASCFVTQPTLSIAISKIESDFKWDVLTDIEGHFGGFSDRL